MTTPASRYPFPPRGAARYLQAVHSLVAQYGGDCWPLDDAPGSAVARSLTGAYPGAVSGVTYTNQVVVSGTLNPDATGTYTAAGVSGSKPYYTNGAFFIYWTVSGANYFIGETLGSTTNRWYSNYGLIGTYTPKSGTTGPATVAAVPASGIYRFDPAGVNFGQQGPLCAGQYAGAAGFDGAAGNVGTNQLFPFARESNFSVCCWIRSTGTSTAVQEVIGKGRATINSWDIWYLGSDGLVVFELNGDAALRRRVYSASGTTPNKWHFVVASYFAGSAVLYVNGNPVGSANYQDEGGFNSNKTVVIGKSATLSAGWFQGDLFAPAIIPAALSPEEIRTLYLTATQGE